MDNHSSGDRGRTRDKSAGKSGGIADSAATKALHKEGDVKQDMGPSVSNTYVADTMTVTNNYNF